MIDQFKPLSEVTDDEEVQIRADLDWVSGSGATRAWNPNLFVKVRPKPKKWLASSVLGWRIIGPDGIYLDVATVHRQSVLDLLNKADPPT